jgi:hypothetical protein
MDMRVCITIILVAAFVVPLLDGPAATACSGNTPTPLKSSELALLQGGKVLGCASSLAGLGGAIVGYGGIVLAASGPIGWGLGAMIVGSWIALAGAGLAVGYNC